jgi:hypothetical protein
MMKMTTDIINVLLTLAQVVSVEDQIVLVPLQETVVTTIKECWQIASEFNKEAVGTGFVSYCLPIVEEAILQ